jgi:orotate phosphoribosyltransferase
LTDDELKLAIREHAYLEGDFVLRSGKRSKYYLDKYRFETRPDILAALGERIAQAVAEA